MPSSDSSSRPSGGGDVLYPTEGAYTEGYAKQSFATAGDGGADTAAKPIELADTALYPLAGGAENTGFAVAYSDVSYAPGADAVVDAAMSADN